MQTTRRRIVMPEMQWSMFVCPECDSLGSSPGTCMNLSLDAHAGIRPERRPVEVVPHSEFEELDGALDQALDMANGMAAELERLRIIEAAWDTFDGGQSQWERLRRVETAAREFMAARALPPSAIKGFAVSKSVEALKSLLEER